MAQHTCHIIGAAPLGGAVPRPQPGDYVIAADGGYAALQAIGVAPDFVMGDFDSLGHTPAHPNVETHPTMKDDTDMMLAVRWALSHGYRRLALYGGLGGARLDHTLANLQTLRSIADHRALGWLTGEGWVVTAVRNGALRFGAEARGFLSVFCSGDTARGVTLRGLKYELEDAALTCGVPLGVSNEFLGKPALVRVADGGRVALWQGEAAPEAADDAGLD